MTSTPTTEANWSRVQRLGKYAGPRYRIDGPPPRRQWNMSAKEVAKLLDNPLVLAERAKVETEAYRQYAAGNKSTSELAEIYINSGNEFAFLVYVLDIEKNILRDAAGFDLIGPAIAPAPAQSPADEAATHREAEEDEWTSTTTDFEAAADKKGSHKHDIGNPGVSIHNEPEQLF